MIVEIGTSDLTFDQFRRHPQRWCVGAEPLAIRALARNGAFNEFRPFDPDTACK